MSGGAAHPPSPRSPTQSEVNIMWNRVLELPLFPLLLTICTTNTALAVILFGAMASSADHTPLVIR